MTSAAADAVLTTSPRAADGGAAQLRADADRYLVDGNVTAVRGALNALWAREAGGSTAAFLVSRYERLRPVLQLPTQRVAILRSFTVEPLVPFVRAGAFAGGLDLSVYTSDFNAYVQEILDPGSRLHAFAPDVAILAVQTRDIAPELWRDFADIDEKQTAAVVTRVTRELRAWIASFRARSQASLVLHNLEEPVAPSGGVLDAQTGEGQSEAIRRINRDLQAAAAEHTGVYVLDYNALVGRHGRARWHDERKRLTVGLPIAAENLGHLAGEWLRYLHPLAGRVAKAVAVDLDNTLWGGVVGEDGTAGIKLGMEYPGAAYLELQRALLDLHRRGVLLAICSKNNPEDAMDVLENHPHMLLRPAHFAAMRINWSDKVQNLRDLARELNIGLDALAFLDDNPVERQHVRGQLPEVHVIELPDDAMRFARVVRESAMFERLRLTAEDARRGSIYLEQRERDQLLQAVTSPDEFYRSLGQDADIARLTASTLSRCAQLINKTNQFNLTTRRYSEQQLRDLAGSPACDCFSIRVRDRFGDNGLVGVAIARFQDGVCDIDTFLLSCRVIGRTVETAFLSFLVEHARRLGAHRIQGWFIPTRKNAPASAFYASHGFTEQLREEDRSLWGLDLAGSVLPRCPEWVTIRIIEGQNV